MRLVDGELRQLAARQFANEAPGQTHNATALVHEAYLRQVGDQRLQNRRHIFATVAEAIRHDLTQNTRSKGRLERGGDRVRLELIDQASSELNRLAHFGEREWRLTLHA